MRQSKNHAEDYFNSLLKSADPAIQQARQHAAELGLERISLGDMELAILKTLVKLSGAKKFVEIGTLTGVSGLAILSALPQGAELWTFEKEPRHAQLAEPVLKEQAAKKNQKVHLVLGDAQKTLEQIENDGPFQGIFIDGNKSAYGSYLAWAEKHLSKGALLVADNVFLGGGVWGEKNHNFSAKQIEILNQFNQRLMDSRLYQTSLLPTLEGFSASVKLF